MVLPVGLLGIAIPFTSKDTAPSDHFEGLTDPANACEQVDKCEIGFRLIKGQTWWEHLFQGCDDITWRDALARFPAAYGSLVHLQCGCNFRLGVIAAKLS